MSLRLRTGSITTWQQLDTKPRHCENLAGKSRSGLDDDELRRFIMSVRHIVSPVRPRQPRRTKISQLQIATDRWRARRATNCLEPSYSPVRLADERAWT